MCVLLSLNISRYFLSLFLCCILCLNKLNLRDGLLLFFMYFYFPHHSQSSRISHQKIPPSSSVSLHSNLTTIIHRIVYWMWYGATAVTVVEMVEPCILLRDLKELFSSLFSRAALVHHSSMVIFGRRLSFVLFFVLFLVLHHKKDNSNNNNSK